MGEFVAAVHAIERFLVPFECWTLNEYGLYGDDEGRPDLSRIDDPTKAAALLRLFDLTIGAAEGSVVPYGLSNALDQVCKTAPDLEKGQVFRRLAALARRT